MEILVTGGAGFIGSNLVDKLISNGHNVEVWDNLSTGKTENINEKAFFRQQDVRFIDHLFEHRKFDVIFHLAALARIQPSFENPPFTCDNNIMGTLNVLELARRCGAKVVYAGSSSFYHDPLVNPYSFSKWVGEECCKMYHKVHGTPVSMARFFNVYGPRQLDTGTYATVIGIFEKQKKAGLPLTVTGTGEKRRDFTHVQDVVSGLIAISRSLNVQWNGEIFNFGTGTNHSILGVAQMFQPDQIEWLPNRPGEALVTKADTHFSQQVLGWNASFNLPTYVEKFLNQLNS